MSSSDTLEQCTARLKALLNEKNALLSQLTAFEAEVEEHKKARDEKNKLVSELKTKRNEALNKTLDERKKLEEALSRLESGKKVDAPYGLLKRKLAAIEWEYQTGAQNVKRERELVKQIEGLEHQLSDIVEFKTAEQEVQLLQMQLKEAGAEASACHNALLLQAEESQKHHLALKEVFEKTRQTREKLGAVDEETEKLRVQAPVQQPQREAAPSPQREAELRRRAEKILEDFKGGKKITVEELALLERYELY